MRYPADNGHKFAFVMPRPMLTIESTGGRSLGRCYSASGYRVTSLRRISQEGLWQLRELGFLGLGQEFSVASQCDGKEEPGLTVEAPCVEYDASGKALPGPAINPYSGLPYEPSKYTYYVYDCESRVDSSD